MPLHGEKNYLNIILKDQKKLINKLFLKTKRFISFLILNSLFISLVCFSLTYFSFLMFDLEPNLKLLFAMFFTMFGVYNLNKLTDKEEDSVNLPERANYILGNEKAIIIITILSYFTALLLGIFVNILDLIVILFPLFAGIIYSVKLLPKIPRLKDITGMKNIIAALSWTVGIVFLPVISSYKGFIITILISSFIFINLLVNAIIFDIRDIKGDRKNNIKTIPVVIGRQKTEKMLLIIHSILIPWLVLSIYWGFFTRYLPVLIFCIIYGYWYIYYFCNAEKIPKFATDILVDGEWIFVALLCFIITII
ncbi:UbiA family prenyltransferase [Methanobacterium veterum]|uniref:UbiA family prenyltransferase n=3 Tax=Methanobacteriaceae TaxID=2159 RepID=A0A9E5DJP3_9EURY|nr:MULTISPECIES: UbiA family prenyltransferase [Methanobacterium]MCZ3366118.1 UbiA family prenyltransferase [Methanobacterium veterum]MCZ3371654.1 UbiA family prenyltransferase [Methanobacterium veterum]